jgi:hypothetical protein
LYPPKYQHALLPQGKVEADRRKWNMVAQMYAEGFGAIKIQYWSMWR